MSIDDQIRECHRMISFHEEQFRESIKPYIDHLVFLESLKPVKILMPVQDEGLYRFMRVEL